MLLSVLAAQSYMSSKLSKEEEQEQARLERGKEEKRRKKELKEQQERERRLKEEQAVIDRQVVTIYSSGLAEAYKFFLQEAYKEEVRFNIFEYAAQKILKFEKQRKEKAQKLSHLQN